MSKLAIVGSGIAGLGAAWYLSEHYDLSLFEKNSYTGGHTRTTFINRGEEELGLDTGFIVYNETTYPNLTRLFRELAIETEKSDMSFSFHNLDSKLQFSGKSLRHLFARKIQLLSFPYLYFLLQALCFNRSAQRDLENSLPELTLKEYLALRGYNSYFIHNYIIPMGSAIWSMPFWEMLHFPAHTFIHFFHNHGFLGLNKGLQWRTVKGGSTNYVRRICLKLKNNIKNNVKSDIFLNETVYKVRRRGDKVELLTEKGQYHFDKVLIATHADTALALLEEPSPLERELLSLYRYQKNRAILHSDAALMPPLRSIWSSWNYKLSMQDEELKTATVYYLNLLQNLRSASDYFVSMNEFEAIDPNKIIETIEYEHPLFDQAAIDNQNRLQQLNGGPIYFAGSYFRYGFHEDALYSALQVVKRLRDGFQILSV